MQKSLQNFLTPDTSDKDWEEYETYWVCNSPQRSEKWFEMRKFRITGSNFGTAADMNRYETSRELFTGIVTGCKKPISERAQKAMDHGTLTEDTARTWYEKLKGVDVKELGIAVPKWDYTLGSSVDGIVGEDGIIEIKCPVRMYEPLIIYAKKIKNGWKPDKYYNNHISPSHYCQMQGGMAILKRKWCDYVVYTDKEKFVCRVYFNKDFWNNNLYPKLKNFSTQLEIGLSYLL